jgi:hypothetical protein
MYYLVSVGHNGMVAHLMRTDCERLEVLYIQYIRWD